MDFGGALNKRGSIDAGPSPPVGTPRQRRSSVGVDEAAVGDGGGSPRALRHGSSRRLSIDVGNSLPIHEVSCGRLWSPVLALRSPTVALK